MSHGPCGRGGVALRPPPGSCAIVRVAPISASITVRWTFVVMLILLPRRFAPGRYRSSPQVYCKRLLGPPQECCLTTHARPESVDRVLRRCEWVGRLAFQGGGLCGATRPLASP